MSTKFCTACTAGQYRMKQEDKKDQVTGVLAESTLCAICPTGYVSEGKGNKMCSACAGGSEQEGAAGCCCCCCFFFFVSVFFFEIEI